MVASKPLSYNGELIEDFSVRFKDGKVVEVKAKKNQKLLEQMVKMDEGASMLGECALIAYDTPIRKTGLLFYNTLFDENAACHFALGAGFPDCIKGGLDMTHDQLVEHKILLEKNPDYIFASKLMEKYATDYGNALSTLNDSKKFVEKDKKYITVIKSANPSNSHANTNKTKSLAISAFLAFICSICIVVFWNMLCTRTKSCKTDEK